jgi:D-glycero-D-manno-heptose 1,7-bisphosphate phosphatase
MNRAVFLDRDGVLIEDVDLLTQLSELRVLAGVPEALRQLKQQGFRLIVITNQAAVARGLITELQLRELHIQLDRELVQAGAPPIDGYYYCPHHPNATVPAYRLACACRKPEPGLLLNAARDHQIALPASFTIGDRITDIIAGSRAGSRTILVQTGRHLEPPIVTREPIDPSIRPDFICDDLPSAVAWIFKTQ